MSEPSRREWRFHVDDMINFAGRVLAYARDVDQGAFVANDRYITSIKARAVP